MAARGKKHHPKHLDLTDRAAIEKPSRPILDEKEIQRCHEIVDDLVRLHRETDPVHGSEKYKSEQAYQAINQVGMLAAILTEWAEAHIIGCYYNIAKSKEQWIDDDASNSHANELMWYVEELPDTIFTNDNYLMCNRTAIAAIIRNTWRRGGITGWRMALSESLQALNDGQVEWFLTPTNTKLQGDAYEISNLKYAAVNHVYKLMGKGWKKSAAQQKVAECCGTTFEAIKKWEKQIIKERDRKKEGLKGMQRGSIAIEICRKAPDHDEEEFLIYAVNRCINTDIKDEEDKKTQALFCDITFCYKLDQQYPLETLKDRLIEAGMRKSD